MKHEMTLLSVVQCLLAASMNNNAFFDGDKCAKFRVFGKLSGNLVRLKRRRLRAMCVCPVK